MVHWPKPRNRPAWMSDAQYAASPEHLTAFTKPSSTRCTSVAGVSNSTSVASRRPSAWTYLLAYNLIRLLMAQAAAHSGQAPRQLSFKRIVQLWSEWNSRALCRDARADVTLLFDLIAQVRVGNRPGRSEPRARKRRPKSFPWLKVPRHVARRRNPNHPTWLRVK